MNRKHPRVGCNRRGHQCRALGLERQRDLEFKILDGAGRVAGECFARRDGEFDITRAGEDHRSRYVMVFEEGQGAEGQPARTDETLLSPGVVITGGTVSRSVLSPACYVDNGAIVSDSVILHGVHVGAGAVVRNAIIDKSVDIPPGTKIGVDQEEDRKRGFMVEDGLTILGKGQQVPA